MAKMFRWLKGSKSKRKDKPANDCYGFKEQNSNYGFRGGNESTLDSSVHIYDEISEVPEISFSRQFTLIPDEINLEKNTEGPYLVVPILPARRTPVNSHCDNGQSEIRTDSGNTHRKRKERVYTEPWDMIKEDDTIHPAYRDSDSGYTCNSVSTKSSSERTTSSDTGCEYDASISSGSDVSSEYKELISKMQNNLALKHQVLKMIKESDSDKQNKRDGQSKKASFSSLDSCEFMRSCDFFEIDDEGSGYSSGFDDCETNENDSNDFNQSAESSEYKVPKSIARIRSDSLPDQLIIRDSKNQSNRNISNTITNSQTEPEKRNRKAFVPYVPNSGSVSSTSSKRNSWSPMIPKPTNVYNTKNFTRKTSSNRLLGDLINMNHNIQTLKF